MPAPFFAFSVRSKKKRAKLNKKPNVHSKNKRVRLNKKLSGHSNMRRWTHNRKGERGQEGEATFYLISRKDKKFHKIESTP